MMTEIRQLLIITNTIDMGGRETRLLGEMAALKSQYINVHFINLFANRSKRATNLLNQFTQVIDYHLSGDVADISVAFIMNTTARIIEYCRKHHIEAIYIHNSDIEALIGALVAQQLKLPIFCTLHDKGMVYSNRLNPVLHFIFYQLILPSLSIVITMSYSLGDIVRRYAPNNLLVIPNLVNTEFFSPKVLSKNNKRLLIVSRLNIVKYKGVLDCIDYAYRLGIEHIDIAGDGIWAEHVKTEVETSGLSDYINFLGERDDIAELMLNYHIVAGVDRVILEAIASEKPALMIDSNGIAGFITEDNIQDAAYRNFSGRNLAKLSFDELSVQYAKLDNLPLKELRKYVEQHHSEVLWSQYTNAYLSKLHFIDNPIIADLYAVLGHFSNALKPPFYQSQDFISLLEDIISSHYYKDSLGRAFTQMQQRNKDKFQYPNINHHTKFFLKTNKPVLPKHTLVTLEACHLDTTEYTLALPSYNLDIWCEKFYTLFAHFYLSYKMEIILGKQQIIISFELYDLVHHTSIICSEDVSRINYIVDKGFYRLIPITEKSERIGVQVELKANIQVSEIKLRTNLGQLSFDKIHLWVNF